MVSFVSPTHTSTGSTGAWTASVSSFCYKRSHYLSSTSFRRRSQLNLITSTTSASAPTAPASVRTANVVIVGGGPCGSMAAIQLHQRGVPVTLIERSSDFSNFDVSRAYFLGIDFRGRGVLDSVPGLLEYVTKQATSFDKIRQTHWEPEGNVQTFTIPLKTADGRSDFWILRAGLLAALKTFVLSNCDKVTPMYGTSLKKIRFEKDGNMELLLETNGEEHYLHTRLILACDGKNSIVKKELEKSEEEDDALVIKNSHGCGDTSCGSPAVGLKVKSIVLKERIISDIESKQHDSVPYPNSIKVLNGQTKRRPAVATFNTVMFPMPPKYLKVLGGTLGVIVARSNHVIWKLNDVENGYKLFQANHPQAFIREYISSAEMGRFVSARGLTFPFISRSKSLIHHIGRSSLGGVVALGDAAHCFPPDLAQGVNAAFLDIKILLEVFDNAGDKEQIQALLQRYEELRDGETSALISLHRVAAPYQYGQSTLGSQLAFVNVSLRRTLEKILPRVFHAPMRDLLRRDLSYGEIVRRADVTTQRLHLVAVSVFLIPLAGVIASGLSR